MGLDMYLTAKKYLSGWSHNKDKREKSLFAGTLKAAGLTMKDITPDSPAGYVEFYVAYWRKANAIHDWFVKNCQKGVDDCGVYPVGREQLEELTKLCKQVLADPTLGPKLLPTKAGFFFGGTDYDEYYIEDLKRTVKQLESILGNRKFAEWDFEYWASW